MSISQKYLSLKAELGKSCIESGREKDDCLLLAVSKTVGVDEVAQAIDAGAMDFGENRPDQLLEKYEAFPNVRWHFIGNIQSRRIRDIVSCAYLIHSLYKLDHAKKIDRAAFDAGKVQDVLLEVNVSGEESKSGMTPNELPDFVNECLSMENIRLRGLMTMAPQGDLAAANDCFKKLRDLKESTLAALHGSDEKKLAAFDQLSMGMSEDWKQAVSQGSTIVRLGRAIFSEEF